MVLNSSLLIFLAKLDYLNQFVESFDNFYIPQSVADEIGAKLDPASQTVQALINSAIFKFGHPTSQPLSTV